MDATPEQVEAGHAFYTKRTLAIYNLAILGFFSRVAWRCPARRIREHYDTHASANHLDVGVGTGYFLDHCRFPSPTPRVAMLDLSATCLEVARNRIERYEPEIYQANILEPIPFNLLKFDSLGLNYVLHCLPGADIHTKGAAIRDLKALMNPGGVVFGATLLHDGVQKNWFAGRVMDRNNADGIFSNAHDDLAGLSEMLSQHLSRATVEVIGCVGVFSGNV